MALVTQHVMNTCQEDYDNMVLITVGTPDMSNKTEHFSYGQMHSDTFKRRVTFGFALIISALYHS